MRAYLIIIFQIRQAVPEHQDGSARACSSPPCPSKYQPPNSQKGAETDISTLLSADILALLLHCCFADPLLWNVWALGSPCNAGKLFAASNTFGAIAILQDEQGEPAI